MFLGAYHLFLFASLFSDLIPKHKVGFLRAVKQRASQDKCGSQTWLQF